MGIGHAAQDLIRNGSAVTKRHSAEVFEVPKMLGIAIFLLLMGGTLVLMSVELINTDDEPGTGGRIVAFLFGGLIVFMGGRIGGLPLLALAEGEGVKDWVGALLLGLRLMVKRANIRSVVSALFLAALAAGYWAELHGTEFWGTSRDVLIDLVTLEFLVIHGFPFFVLASSPIRIPGKARAWGMFFTGLLCLLYFGFAWTAGNWWGILSLAYLLMPNLLAFGQESEEFGVRTITIARWALKFVAIVGVAMALDQHRLQGSGNLKIGLYYFGIQALIELFRLTEAPLDLGVAWARLPAHKRRQMEMRSS